MVLHCTPHQAMTCFASCNRIISNEYGSALTFVVFAIIYHRIPFIIYDNKCLHRGDVGPSRFRGGNKMAPHNHGLTDTYIG